MSAEEQQTAMDTTEQMDMNAAAEDDRKLFVGGLPQDAKDNDIKEHFGQYGEIDGVNLKTDPSTGRSRGFAFVVFKATEGVEAAVACDEHVLKGKKVAVKKAQAKQGKIYVGKLKPELSDDEIKNFFSGYGNIAQVEQPFDKAKNERKNFCFITFDKEETAKTLLKEGVVTINGHELEIKKVTPKPAGPMGGMGGFGGRGGGRGGQNNFGGYGGPQWGGNYGGYGDAYGWGGYGGPDPYSGYGNPGAWGGYGGGNQWGGYGGPQMAGGKTRGARGGASRGRGVGAGRGQRQKPY